MSGQKDKIYDERIPYTAIEIYAGMKQMPKGFELTFEQIYKVFNLVSKQDMRKCLTFLIKNNMVLYNNNTLTYTINENKNIRIFKG